MKISFANEDRSNRQALSCVWREVPSVPASSGCPRTRFKHAACIHDSHVYICSGKDSTSPLKDFWRYSIGSNGKWEHLALRGSSPPHLEGHTLVSYKRLVLVFGGEFSTWTSEPPLWVVNIDQQHVHKPCGDNSVPQPSGRRGHTAVVHCGIMYVYGGFVDLRGSSSELWGYHIEEEFWQLYPALSVDTPGGRHGHSCGLYQNAMWMFGGHCDLTLKAELWKYNLLTRIWTRIKCVPSPPPMSGHSANVLNGHMILIGGESQGQLYRDIWAYSLESNFWRKISLHNSPHQPLPCSQHVSVSVTKDNTGEERTDNSARCFSEPSLLRRPPTKNMSGRPRTSPSPMADSACTAASKWVYPVRSCSNNCDILSLVPPSNRTHLTSETSARNSQVISGDDSRPLLRFVSRDSNESVGIDNVVDCTADESQESRITVSETHHSANTKEQPSALHDLPQEGTGSPVQTRPNSQPPARPGTLQMRCSSSDSITRSASRQTTSHRDIDCPYHCQTAQPHKIICSKYCADMYIEDIEQGLSPIDSPITTNPFAFSNKLHITDLKQMDSIELDLFPPQIKRSGALEFGDTMTTFTHANNTLVNGGIPNGPLEKEKLDSRLTGDCKKVLVTVATQTGSNLDIHEKKSEESRNVSEDNEGFFRGVPFLLVIGGKSNQGQRKQQPIKVWRCDLTM